MSTNPDQRPAASDRLSTLPVELTTEILSSLPATRIALCQRISRRFKDIIDEPNNRLTIYSRSIDGSRARLRESAALLFEYRMEDSGTLIPALQDFFRHRGLAVNRTKSWDNASAFATLWDIRETSRKGVSLDDHKSRIGTVKQIVCAVRKALLQSRGYSPDYPLRLPGEFIVVLKACAIEPWMEDEAAVMELYEKIIAPDGLFSGVRVHDNENDTDPLWLATYLDSTKGGAAYLQRVLFVSTEPHFCHSSVLASALDLPEFPTPQDFAYATTSGWTHGKLKQWVERGDMALTALEKAAVLEDLRFY